MAFGTFTKVSMGEKTLQRMSASPLENRAFTLHIISNRVGSSPTQHFMPSYAPSVNTDMLFLSFIKQIAVMHITKGKTKTVAFSIIFLLLFPKTCKDFAGDDGKNCYYNRAYPYVGNYVKGIKTSVF